MSEHWLDVARARQLIGGPGEKELRESFDPQNELHMASLLALSDDERVAILKNQERPAYMGGRFHRAVGGLSFQWVRTRPRDALVLFDALLQVDNRDLATYCNALWAVQDDNTHLGKDPERAHRYIAASLPYGPKNPAIFYNAACVAVELGELEAALGFVKDAIRFGYSGRETMRTAFQTEPLFAKVRDDPRFFEALDDRGPQGAALVERVISRVKEAGWSALGIKEGQSDAWPRHARDFRPLSPELLAGLMLPNGAPLPPGLRTWLAFDAGFLASLGWFELEPAFRWTSRSLRQIAKAEYGGGDGPPSAPVPVEHEDGEVTWEVEHCWAWYFDVPYMEHGFLLPGGSESRRVWMLSSAPDSEGDYPVLYLDISDAPSLGPMHPGLDVWLADEASVIAIQGETYTSAFRDFRFAARLRHHARAVCRGSESVGVPRDELGPPPPDDGETVSLARDDWFERLLALREKCLPADGLPITGASAEERAWLEGHLGVPLPPPVARLYERVNGLSWGTFRFLSIAEIKDAAAQRACFGDAPPPDAPFAVIITSPPQSVVLIAQDGAIDAFNLLYGELRMRPVSDAIEGAINIVRHSALWAGTAGEVDDMGEEGDEAP